MVSPGRSGMSKLTGRSTPFKLSLRPLLFSTKRGAEMRSKCISRPISFWKVSRMYLIASWVSRMVSRGS